MVKKSIVLDDSDNYPRIIAKNLEVTYPLGSFSAVKRNRTGFKALDGINFELKAGRRLGLLGRNGSGKSTLLRTLAGVFPPSGGTLDIKGEIASIFNATSGFLPNATGRENIVLRGYMLGLDYDEIKELIPGIVEFSELGDWIDQPIYQYSSGMTLRLAFSITTALRSDILLMDEWLGAGDAEFLAKAQKRMDEMVENAQIIVLASHNMPLLSRVCDTCLVLSDSKVIFSGNTKEAIKLYRGVRDGA
ncbi:ABC transporter ATP-binding protein [Robiginitomaculum antarcticum]|uniref:ABC transporter ATP-binding protein n=1 Tax=Robiginitomaculum antarcticum TaxID=437507 RepID=UPI0003A85BB6|nr:ABC transporter ATP-binding protein [Robiginitomaculum antarcticum]